MAKSINRLLAELLDVGGDVKIENLDQAPTVFDSDEIINISNNTGVGLQYYDTLDSLPISGLIAGDQAYVAANKRMYISNGSGWYNVALINLTPTMSLDQSGTIILSTEGVATTVTITAQDSDNPDAILSYSVESDGNGIGNYTLSQDSSVFTITPLSEDSGASTSTFTLTFKTTDNINTATSDLDFSLTFSSVVDSSSATILLIKADGNSAGNSAITYQNSSDVSTGWTETGAPQAGTFSPYRSGGYSAYFDGNGDFLSVPSSDVNIKTLSASNFTVEGWFYKDDTQNNIFLFAQRGASGTSYSGIQLAVDISNRMALLGATDLVSWDVSITGSTTVTQNEWHHFAVVKNSTTYTLYLDGVSQGTSTAGTLVYASGNPALVIGTVWSSSSSQYDWHGYIKDFRVSDNARYTTAFTPPTEPFASDGNTELLACSLPYFGDVSSTDATITTYGNISTRPFGPYDYEPWAADDHAGSVFFDGTDDVLTSATNITSIAAGNYTVEFWYYPTKNLTDQQTLVHFNSGSNGGTNIWYGGSSGANIRVDNGLQGQSSFTDVDLTLNAWHHIAITRSSTTTKGYINGKLAGSHTYTPNGTNRVVLGRFTATPYYANGYIADFRYVPGSVVYSAEFTPPTAPLSHISNTDLLMNNKSDANIYDAAAATTLEATGAVSSTSVRKFSTSSSVYFDGSNDSVLGTETIDLGAGDFTIEFWYNHPSTPATDCTLVDLQINGSVYSTFAYYYASGNRWQTYVSSAGSSWDLISAYTTIENPNNNQWYHYALVRDGTNMKIYLDGVYLGNWSVSTTALSPSTLRLADWNNGAAMYGGYIQDFRISKTARYTGATNFTPPTAEFEL